MSYTSNYNLNIRLSAIEARLNALVPVPPGFAYDLLSVLGVGNNAGANDIDMNNNNIDNVTDINGNPVVIDLQTACNNANGISNFLPANTATITSTNFTNARQLLLNDNANPTIQMVDNNNASHFTTLDIDTINLDGTTTTWADIVSGSATSNTLQEVLTAGNTADLGFNLTSLVAPVTSSVVAGIDTTTSSKLNCGFSDNSFTTSTEINAQSGATEYLASVADTGTNLSTKRFFVSNGSIFNRDRATDGTVVVTSDELTDYTTQVSSEKSLVSGTGKLNLIRNLVNINKSEDFVSYADTFNTSSSTINAEAGIARKILTATALSGGANVTQTEDTTPNNYDNQIVANNQSVPTITARKTEQIGSGVGTNSELNYFDSVNQLYTQYNVTTNGGASSAFIGASNIGTGSSHFIRTEVPTSGDALIEHSVIGTNRNLGVSTTGNFLLTSDNLNSTTGNLSFLSTNAGGVGAPTLTLTNQGNTATGVALKTYKQKPVAGIAGDVIFQHSAFGKDSANNEQEYTRITHAIRDPTNGAEDGSIEMGALVNGTYTNFIQLNGNDTPIGEVNIFRPLDFTGGSDANSTIKTSGTGSVNLNIDATTSAGTGAIALKTKNGVAGSGGGLLLTGNTLLSASAGGGSGQHLCLTIGGTVYKIALLNA